MTEEKTKDVKKDEKIVDVIVKGEELKKKIELLSTQYDRIGRQIDQIDAQREQMLALRNNLTIQLAKLDGNIESYMEVQKDGSNS